MIRFDEIDIQAGVIPTSFGTVTFHPAFIVKGEMYYWPNVTEPSAEAATEVAKRSLNDAFTQTLNYMRGWNVWPTSYAAERGY